MGKRLGAGGTWRNLGTQRWRKERSPGFPRTVAKDARF